MKIIQSSIFRSICAIVIGVLLIKYRDQAVTGMTIAIGILFFISGLISCIAYFSAKKKSSGDAYDLYDANGRLIKHSTPTFPIVGIGSLLLGAILALMPNTFISGLVYVLGAILILGAINQFFNLTIATRFAHIGFFWWLFPAIILLIGLLSILKPDLIASAPLLVLGWCMMVYGVVEIINSVKIHQCRKRFVKVSSDQDAANQTAEGTTDTSATAEDPKPNSDSTQQ
jgi:uncharacterized membrane protein HdeD (DUF308 family)